jgi:hypothetical protein
MYFCPATQASVMFDHSRIDIFHSGLLSLFEVGERSRRRLENVARLLENPNNIRVAPADVDGQFIAATN